MIYDRETLENSLSLSSDKGGKCEIKSEKFGVNTLNIGGTSVHDLSLIDLFNLKQAIDKKMSEESQLIFDLSNFHKNSHRHWSNYRIGKDDITESDFSYIGTIIEERPLYWYYKAEENDLSFEEVRKKVIQDFFKQCNVDESDYDLVHCTEETSIYTKTEQNIIDLYQWMDDKIIQPYVQYIMEKNGITEVNITEEKVSIS